MDCTKGFQISDLTFLTLNNRFMIGQFFFSLTTFYDDLFCAIFWTLFRNVSNIFRIEVTIFLKTKSRWEACPHILLAYFLFYSLGELGR